MQCAYYPETGNVVVGRCRCVGDEAIISVLFLVHFAYRPRQKQIESQREISEQLVRSLRVNVNSQPNCYYSVMESMSGSCFRFVCSFCSI